MKVTRAVRDILRARITVKLTELVKTMEAAERSIRAKRNAAVLALIDQHGSKCFSINIDHAYRVDCGDDFDITPFFGRKLRKINMKFRVKRQELAQPVHFAGLDFYLHGVPVNLKDKFEKLSTAIDNAIMGQETKDLIALVAKL